MWMSSCEQDQRRPSYIVKGGDQRQEKEDQQDEHETRTFVWLRIGLCSRAGLLDRHCSASLMLTLVAQTGVHNRSSGEHWYPELG